MKPKSGSPEPKYIDRPEITEVFADRLEHLFFDGTTVRMEFTVTRTDPAQANPDRTVTAKQWSYTAARVVMSGRGAAEMLNKMSELQTVMLQQGFLTAKPREEPGLAPVAEGPAAPPQQG